MALTVVAAHGNGWSTEATELVQNALDLLAVNAIGRAVREIFKTWSRSKATAGFNVVHADGTGLTASEQRWVNLVRDALYTATSLLLLFGGQALAKEWLAKVAASVADIPSAFAAAALLNIFTGLNDMCEGWTMDMARVICKLIWGDEYVLQPGTQHNPGWDPTHFLTHAAARLTTGPIIDLFGAAAMVAAYFGLFDLGKVLQSMGARFNGGARRLSRASAQLFDQGTDRRGRPNGAEWLAEWGCGCHGIRRWQSMGCRRIRRRQSMGRFRDLCRRLGRLQSRSGEVVALHRKWPRYLRSPASEASVSAPIATCAG